MATRTYKGYTIRITGLSHHIYRSAEDCEKRLYAPGYGQSFAEAKRWINQDIKEQNTKKISQNVVVWQGLR